MFQIFTFGDNFTNPQEIVARNRQNCRAKLSPIVTSFYSKFAVASNGNQKPEVINYLKSPQRASNYSSDHGLRTWIEYGFRQCKQELGWTDYRFTNFREIEKWWEIIFCVYTMISLNSQPFLSLNYRNLGESKKIETNQIFSSHQHWQSGKNWKSVLNNWRLIIQPTIALWVLSPWLNIFANSDLLRGFHNLIQIMNQFTLGFPDG